MMLNSQYGRPVMLEMWLHNSLDIGDESFKQSFYRLHEDDQKKVKDLLELLIADIDKFYFLSMNIREISVNMPIESRGKILTTLNKNYGLFNRILTDLGVSGNDINIFMKPSPFILPNYDKDDLFLVKNESNLTAFGIPDIDEDIRESFKKLDKATQYRIIRGVYGLNKYTFSDDINLTLMPDWDYNLLNDYIKDQFKSFINNLEDDTIYKCLVVGIEEDGGLLTARKSLFVSKYTNPLFLLYYFIITGQGINIQYRGVNVVNWTICYKKWLTKDVLGDNVKKAIEVVESKNVKYLSKELKSIKSVTPPPIGASPRRGTNVLFIFNKESVLFILYNFSVGRTNARRAPTYIIYIKPL